jgi:hypothetical protein
MLRSQHSFFYTGTQWSTGIQMEPRKQSEPVGSQTLNLQPKTVREVRYQTLQPKTVRTVR